MNKLYVSEIIANFTIDSLGTYIQQSQEIEFIVSCSSFGAANSNLDIAEDYLFALFLGENIHHFCKSVDFTIQSSAICFTINVKNAQDFALAIFQLLNKDEDVLEELLRAFEYNLNEQEIFFHDLADRYMANWIAGKDDLSLSEDNIEHINRIYPEQKFGFWRSFVSHHVGYNVYTSPWAWIVPYNRKQRETTHNLNTLLLSYGWFSELPVVEESINISIGNLLPVVINSSMIMRFPREGLRIAQMCADSILQANDISYSSTYSGDNRYFKTSISEDGNLMIVEDRLAQYIFFSNNSFYSSETELTFESIEPRIEQDYQSAFDNLSDMFSSLAGNAVNISCPWDKIYANRHA